MALGLPHQESARKFNLGICHKIHKALKRQATYNTDQHRSTPINTDQHRTPGTPGYPICLGIVWLDLQAGLAICQCQFLSRFQREVFFRWVWDLTVLCMAITKGRSCENFKVPCASCYSSHSISFHLILALPGKSSNAAMLQSGNCIATAVEAPNVATWDAPALDSPGATLSTSETPPEPLLPPPEVSANLTKKRHFEGSDTSWHFVKSTFYTENS